MNKKIAKVQRQTRIRKKIRRASKTLRLSVFRSNRYVYAQIIDDQAKKTLVGISEKQLEDKKEKTPKIQRAQQLGKELAKLALEKKISKVVFDKGSYKYHGRVKAIAEGAREGGLQF